MNPMIPFLTGWLWGAVTLKSGEAMKLVDVRFEAPNAFIVALASGLELRVKVEVAKTATVETWPAALT